MLCAAFRSGRHRAELDAPVDPCDGTCRPWRCSGPLAAAARDAGYPPSRAHCHAARVGGLAARRSGLLGREGPCRRAPQPLDLDPSAASGFLGLDGLVDGGGQAAADRLCLHPGTTVLAGRAACALGGNAADLLRLHGADLWRQAVDHAVHRLAHAAGHRHWLRRAEPGNALLHLPGTGASVRSWGGQLRLFHGQHRLLLPQGREG